MTEQKLSLDEMIDLANLFDRVGKWELLSSKQSNPILNTSQILGLHMVFAAENTDNSSEKQQYVISMGRVITYADGIDDFSLACYSVKKSSSPEYFQKLEKLFEKIYTRFNIFPFEEYALKKENVPFDEQLEERRKSEAIDAARKLIGK